MCMYGPVIDMPAPEFNAKALVGGEEKDLALTDYKGKWVILIFYPGDFTFVCPTELEDTADMYDQFQKEEAEILSISKDTIYVHKAWKDSSPAIQKVQYPMLSDSSGIISQAYRTYIYEGQDAGLAQRGTFIIDPDGVLKTVEIHNNSIGRDAGELLRKLQAAKFVRENTGLVCPAKWKPGGDTLEPGMDLVGKI
ncbi:redoxin domain-containing protein [Patescibacteria group bacterium]